MDADRLKSELDRVTAELEEARLEQTLLRARITGLEARRAELAKAIPAAGSSDGLGAADLPARYRTEDIIEVLAASGTDMTIEDVVRGLHESGRANETPDNVGADLAYLAKGGRIAKVRRGVYSNLWDTDVDPDRIVITLTQGNLNHNHIYLSRHMSFFPADAIGSANRRDGEGRKLILRFEGLTDAAKTDIVPNHKIFRLRGRQWHDFFQRHRLHAGDKVTIQRLDDYEYRVSPYLGDAA
jgi:hypothetical protein